MAAYSAERALTKTVVANVVDTFTLTGQCAAVEVVHHYNVSDPLYVRVAGATAAPTVAGSDFEVVLPGERLRLGAVRSGSTIVSVICAGAATVSTIAIS